MKTKMKEQIESAKRYIDWVYSLSDCDEDALRLFLSRYGSAVYRGLLNVKERYAVAEVICMQEKHGAIIRRDDDGAYVFKDGERVRIETDGEDYYLYTSRKCILLAPLQEWRIAEALIDLIDASGEEDEDDDEEDEED